ncbi:MAG TPA: TAT-variant-translocated molybdopterin oxidoreductase [Polyangia bacterium]|nr:TAT-variant-translocated molybdopterin oxidoreductase [Polyangia bacterium]
MSCDDNKEARAKDRQKRRSLPIVTAEAPRPSTATAARAAPRYWRSIEEREAAKAIALGAVNEFPPGADELAEGSVSRRGFMQLLGASTALATVGAACRKPNEKIVPFVRRPEELTPGNPLHFATAYALEGFASGLLATSHEGRPTKIEGNPDHPETLGGTTAIEQALVLGLYDDDRAKVLRRGGESTAWRVFLEDTKARAERLEANKGAGLRFLVEPSASPLLGDLRRRILARFPMAKFVSYSSTTSDGAAEGPRLAFGQPLVARHDLDKAKVILSLDADFLGEGPELPRATRAFAARRAPGPEMNRLYVVEPALTGTGAMADHRLRMRGTDIPSFAAALVAELATDTPALAPLAGLPKSATFDQRWIRALAHDLQRSRGSSVVIAGRRQPAAVHALAAAINAALGNVGSTVTYLLSPFDGSSGPKALGALVEDIAAGGVDTLVITASNPVYTAPVDFKLGQLLQRVPTTIYHGVYEDETAAVCGTMIPATHPLETWGDARALDGTVSIVQPLITPLWGAFAETQVLAAFLDEGDVSAHELVRRYWFGQRPGDQTAAFDAAWEKWLADGVLPGTAAQPVTVPAVDGQALATVIGTQLAALTAQADGLELGFVNDQRLHDGRFANNAWLQELPHSITKHTWDNAVMISEATAKAQGFETGDVVALQYRDRSVEGPILIVPGHADDAVTVALGHGREGAGESIAKGVGFNAGVIRTSDAPWYDRGLKLARTGDEHKFAITQTQWTMSPDGRASPPPAVDATLAEVLNEGSKFHEELEERRGPLPTIHEPVDYSHVQYKWGMSIDLNKCTGCNACVVACQAENNIPVVGKENVRKGRHMQWIRIDRYFSGPIADPEVINQPLGCVQCETAPCEYVCPVNATVHSDEGLNEMAYNRCIGTRYCSNNCPYKVRRFNFLDYTSEYTAARMMGTNPDVTVRARGVMEKCTYCVQRIERKRIDTRIAGTTIKDGELQTACQQGCPARAIEFGSLNDPGAKVTRMHADARRYDLLHEIGTRPRTAYLARVRNINPDLAKVD